MTMTILKRLATFEILDGIEESMEADLVDGAVVLADSKEHSGLLPSLCRGLNTPSWIQSKENPDSDSPNNLLIL